MSKFTNFLKEAMEATPGYSNNATSGNVSNKHPVLTRVPVKTSEKKKEDSLQKLIDDNNINIDRDTIETIIALVDKTLEDFNREKNLDKEEILKVIYNAIDLELIDIK